MKNKSKNVYVTHRVKSDCIEKLDKLSQITGKSNAELIEDMIENMYANYFYNNENDEHIEVEKTYVNLTESVFEQELKDAEQRWKDSKNGLNDFHQRMEDWKKEENRKNTMQAEEFKRKIDDWTSAWEKYFRDYSTSIKTNNSYQFKYFNPYDKAEVWKKLMRQYTKQWHPDYAPNEGNPQKFGEMKAEYDILTGKIPTEEYSL